MEAGRPDSITAEKLSVLSENGVTRISINPQTMNDDTLIRIGRKHTAEDVADCFQTARKSGFDNINMDMICGLPGEGIQYYGPRAGDQEKCSLESDEGSVFIRCR